MDYLCAKYHYEYRNIKFNKKQKKHKKDFVKVRRVRRTWTVFVDGMVVVVDGWVDGLSTVDTTWVNVTTRGCVAPQG